MVSKPAIVGVIGGVAILAALALNFWLVPGDDETEEARVEEPAVPAQPNVPQPNAAAPAGGSTAGGSTAGGSTAGGSTTSGSTAGGSGAESDTTDRQRTASGTGTADAGDPAPGDEDAAIRKPSFDIVRVDPEGNAVIAGRARPNAEVTILDGEREIGKVTSDERGEWVFLPDQQLGAGQFALTLRQDGEPATAESDEAVVLVVPEAGKDIAGRPSSEPGQPLAMVLPRDEAASATARVLQAPTAGPDGSASAAPSDQDSAAGQDTAAASGSASDHGNGSAGASGQAAGAGETTETAEAGDAAETGETAAVSVDVIEYDDKGEVVFGGRTEPNAEVEVFIDNQPAGTATADAEGRWQVNPKDPVAPGNYNLRVDKVDEGGAVKARVAFPFVRAAPLKGLPNDRLVVIQPGNNLWVIATRVYGEGMRYVQIHDANRDQIQNPDLIYPGQVFGLPTVN